MRRRRRPGITYLQDCPPHIQRAINGRLAVVRARVAAAEAARRRGETDRARQLGVDQTREIVGYLANERHAFPGGRERPRSPEEVRQMMQRLRERHIAPFDPPRRPNPALRPSPAAERIGGIMRMLEEQGSVLLQDSPGGMLTAPRCAGCGRAFLGPGPAAGRNRPGVHALRPLRYADAGPGPGQSHLGRQPPADIRRGPGVARTGPEPAERQRGPISDQRNDRGGAAAAADRRADIRRPGTRSSRALQNVGDSWARILRGGGLNAPRERGPGQGRGDQREGDRAGPHQP